MAMISLWWASGQGCGVLPRGLISQRDGWESYLTPCPAHFSRSSLAEDLRLHSRQLIPSKWIVAGRIVLSGQR